MKKFQKHFTYVKTISFTYKVDTASVTIIECLLAHYYIVSRLLLLLVKYIICRHLNSLCLLLIFHKLVFLFITLILLLLTTIVKIYFDLSRCQSEYLLFFCTYLEWILLPVILIDYIFEGLELVIFARCFFLFI